MKIAIEYDDFSPRNSNLAILEQIKEHYPGFKVTMFTVPWEIRFGQQTPITDKDFAPWVEAVNAHKDWIEIAVHGLTHLERGPKGNPAEFEKISADETWKRITVAEKMFVNRGIDFVKIFKAPQWLLSKAGKEKLEEMGYTVVEDGYYNWNLKDEFPHKLAEKGDLIIGHGHVQGVCGNGMEETLEKIMRLPVDTKFLTLSEALWKKKKKISK